MEFNGIPVHPLVVHAAVVFAPLAAVVAIVYAWVPRWRWVLRWPMAAVALLGAVSVQLSDLSGEDLKHHLGLNSSLLEKHEYWAGRLVAHSWVLLGIVALSWWALPAATRVAGGVDRVSRNAILDKVLVALLTLAGLALMFVVFKTGDAGARMVWAGQ